VSEVPRRAAGEEFTVTVAGRPVAHLGPADARRWVSGAALAKVWSRLAPSTVERDPERFDGALSDPFSP